MPLIYYLFMHILDINTNLFYVLNTQTNYVQLASECDFLDTLYIIAKINLKKNNMRCTLIKNSLINCLLSIEICAKGE